MNEPTSEQVEQEVMMPQVLGAFNNPGEEVPRYVLVLYLMRRGGVVDRTPIVTMRDDDLFRLDEAARAMVSDPFVQVDYEYFPLHLVHHVEINDLQPDEMAIDPAEDLYVD